MGSKRDLRCAMLHDGLMRRSEDELGELMMRGTSATLWRDILAAGKWMACDPVGASAGWQE